MGFDAFDGVLDTALAVTKRHRFAGGEEFRDFVLSRDDSAVTFAAEGAADLGEGSAGPLAGEEHDEHPRECRGGCLAARFEIVRTHAEDVADRFDDVGEADRAAAGLNEIAERRLGEIQIDGLLVRLAAGAEEVERAGQMPRVAAELASYPVEDFRRNRHAVARRELTQDAKARGEIGRLERADEAA